MTLAYEDLMAQLRTDYREQFPARLQNMKSLVTAKSWVELKVQFHQLAGNGATVGETSVSRISRHAHDCFFSPLNEIKLHEAVKLLEGVQNSWQQANPQLEDQILIFLLSKG